MRPLPSLLHHRRTVLWVAALLAAAMAPAVLGLATDNSPEAFLLADDPRVARYQELRTVFGSDRLVRLVLVGDPAAGAPAAGAPVASWLRAAERALVAVPGVGGVLGPWGALGRPEVWPPADLAADLGASPLARGAGLIAPQGHAVSLLVTLESRALGGSGRRLPARDQLARLRAALPPPPAGCRLLEAGLPVLDEALDASSREIFTRFFPLLVGFAAALLVAAFWPARGAPGGSWRAHAASALLVPLAFVAGCELLGVAVLRLLGLELNLVLAILPPLLFVIALATAIHLVTRYRDHDLTAEGVDAATAVVATFRDKGVAVLWAAASTLAGFGALALAPVAAVRDLGRAAALALAGMGLAAYLVLPALLLAVPRPPPGGAGWFERRVRRLAAWVAAGSVASRRRVLAVATLLAVLALLGLPRLAVQSNSLHYLDAEHPVRRAAEEVEALGIGGSAVELVLAGEPAALASGRGIGALAWLAERLREEPLVLGVLGPGEVVDAALRASPAGRAGLLFGLDGLREATRERLEADAEGRRLLAPWLATDHRLARLVVFTPTAGFAELDALATRLVELAGEELPGTVVEVGGLYPLLLETQRRLLGTLGGSFGVTLAVVAAIFWLLLGRLRWVVAALVPNVLPVLLVFGAMGWLGIPLDLATVMVASTTLGLAVDDTMHSLVHYRALRAELGAEQAVIRTVSANGAAYAITGLALVAGFGVCALSSFAPIAHFGALSAGAILLAVIGDFVLVPALFGGPRGKSAGSVSAA